MKQIRPATQEQMKRIQELAIIRWDQDHWHKDLLEWCQARESRINPDCLGYYEACWLIDELKIRVEALK